MLHSTLRKSFGPGLLFAGAAIGVSHLVQSTRAGAMAGLGLAGTVLLALVLKYPFFEFGPRYAAATGRSLIEGYRDVGQWAVWLYLALTGTTGVVVQVAVTLFTAFLIRYAAGSDWPLWVVTAVLVGGCMALIRWGRYRALDAAIKLVIGVLGVTTLVAMVVTAPRVDFSTLRLLPLDHGRLIVPFGFILALVGWMPTAIDLNVWSSLWTLAKDETTDERTSVGNARLDFQIGYVATGLLAFAFLILGATVMHGADTSFDPRGTVFTTQLVELYTSTLGGWVRPVVLASALATMFSTTLTVVDGMPRAAARALAVLRDEGPQRAGAPSALDAPTERATPTARTTRTAEDRYYWPLMAVLAAITVAVTGMFLGSLTALVDLATILSFLIGPVLGWLTLRVVTGEGMPLVERPGRGMRWWCYLGLGLLGVTAVAYCISWVGRLAGGAG